MGPAASDFDGVGVGKVTVVAVAVMCRLYVDMYGVQRAALIHCNQTRPLHLVDFAPPPSYASMP